MEEKRESKLEGLLRRRRNKRVVSVLVALLALLLVGWLLWQRPAWLVREMESLPVAAPSPSPQVPDATPPFRTDAGSGLVGSEAPLLEEPDPGSADSTSAILDLPDLDESDAFVRRAAAALAEHPEVARWLVSDELVRNFVAAVDNVAEGRSPRKHLAVLAPVGSFLVVGDATGDDPLLADPINERRYDTVVNALDALDPADCARLYRSLQPILEQAFGELGYPDESFEKRLQAAAFELLATPIVPERPRLLPRVKRFEFEDPALEERSDAQKHLLRMGPRNVDRFQRALRSILREIDPTWKPPPIQIYRSPAPG